MTRLSWIVLTFGMVLAIVFAGCVIPSSKPWTADVDITEKRYEETANGYPAQSNESHFFLINVTVVNTGENQAYYISRADFRLYDATDVLYPVSNDATNSLADPLYDRDAQRGVRKSGWLAYEVPKSAQLSRVVYTYYDLEKVFYLT